MLADPVNLTFINVSETGSGYVILEAASLLSEFDGYDQESYGFYNIDSGERIISNSAIENDIIRAEAVVEGPGSGNYALMVKKEQGWINIMIFIAFIAVIGGMILVLSKRKK